MNDERIYRALDKMDEKLDKLIEIQAKHSVYLERDDDAIKEHDETLKEHSKVINYFKGVLKFVSLIGIIITIYASYSGIVK